MLMLGHFFTLPASYLPPRTSLLGTCSGGVYNIRRLVFFNRLTQLARATGAIVTLHK
jgi:hypothetical protein